MSNIHPKYKEYLYEFGEYREERVSSQITYKGYAPKGSEESDPKWIIDRIYVSGTITQRTLAPSNGGGDPSTQIWENRASLFDEITFSNTLSTQFDGVNDFVSLGNNFNFERTEAWTMSFWVRHRVVNTTQYIFSKRAGTTSAGISIHNPGNGRYVVTIYNAAGNQILTQTPTSTIIPNTWYNLVVTYDGSSTAAGVKLYLNGTAITLTATNDTLSASILNSQAAVFGQIASLNYFDGHMDEVSIWSDDLTAAEVTSIFNGGTPADLESHSAASKLLSWWRMGDGDSYPTITDQVGVVPGTMTNMLSTSFSEVAA
jgi:hypothetical protein